MNNKNYNVELLRFIGISLIAFFHVYATGIPYGSYKFANGWMFTDLFFVMTGYYTVVHFEKGKSEHSVKELFFYVWKKIKRFLPFIIPSVVVVYIVDLTERYQSGGITEVLNQLMNLPLEMLLITSGFNYEYVDGIPAVPLNAPLWFLSAMFIVFPLFCFCVSRNKTGIFWVVSQICLVIDIGYSRKRIYTTDLLRAILGLFAGMAIYYLANYIVAKRQRTEWGGYCLLGVVLIMMYKNVGNTVIVSLLLDAIFLLFCISEEHIIPNWMKRPVGFLGALSTPLFIWHWPMARLVRHFMTEAGRSERMTVFVLISAFVACTSYFMVILLQKRNAGRR